MKKKIAVFLGVSHLAIIIIINIESILRCYYEFYYDKKERDKNILYKLSNSFTNLPPIFYYTSCTGTETGYGFFAPNVSSQFVVLFERKNNNNQKIDETILPNFQDKESILRYSTALALYMDKLEAKDKDSLSNKIHFHFIDVLTKEIARDVLKGNKKASTIDATVLLYDYPSLQDYKKHSYPSYFTVKKISNIHLK